MLTATLALLATAPAAYKVIDTGIVTDPTAACMAMNDRGEIVGAISQQDGEPSGFYWKDGKITYVTPPGEEPVQLVDINNDGVAIGSTVRDSPESDEVFLYTKQGGLKTVPVSHFQPFAISNSGSVLGKRFDDESDTWALGLWKSGSGFKPLVTGTNTLEFWEGSLNDADQVVYDEQVAQLQAFRVSGAPTMLPSIPSWRGGWAWTRSAAINGQGWVCGSIEAPRSLDLSPYSGAIWAPNGTLTQIGTRVRFRDINDGCVAVGSQRLTKQFPRAVVWDRTHGMRYLDDLVPEGSPKLASAAQIDKAGNILCSGVSENGRIRWYLLTAEAGS